MFFLLKILSYGYKYVFPFYLNGKQESIWLIAILSTFVH